MQIYQFFLMSLYVGMLTTNKTYKDRTNIAENLQPQNTSAPTQMSPIFIKVTGDLTECISTPNVTGLMNFRFDFPIRRFKSGFRCEVVIKIEVPFTNYSTPPNSMTISTKNLPERGTTILEFEKINLPQSSSKGYNWMRLECDKVNIKVTGIMDVAPMWCVGNTIKIIIHLTFYDDNIMIHFKLYAHTYFTKYPGSVLTCWNWYEYHDFTRRKYRQCNTEHGYNYYIDVPEVFKCNRVKELFSVETFDKDEEQCKFNLDHGCGPNGLSFGNDCFYLISLEENSISCLQGKIYPAFHLPSVRKFVVKEVSKYRTRYVSTENGFDNSYVIVTGIEQVYSDNHHLSYLYRRMWWWKKHKIIIFDNFPFAKSNTASDFLKFNIALVIYPSSNVTMQKAQKWTTTICHSYNINKKETLRKYSIKISSKEVSTGLKFNLKSCLRAFFVHLFHYCVTEGTFESMGHASPWGMSLFQCINGLKVHYTLLCDGNNDCGDLSDEKRCPLPTHFEHLGNTSWFQCTNSKEFVTKNNRCDGKPDCIDASDEIACLDCKTNTTLNYEAIEEYACFPDLPFCTTKYIPNNYSEFESAYLLLDDLRPYSVELDGCGGSYFTPLNDTENCPETHVRCPDAYCIPTYMLNNGVYDCPHLETNDEYVGSDFSCPGHYRCYKSYICVHPNYLCDGIYHCPLKDDERYCNTCPDNCICEGWSIKCHNMFNFKDHLYLRYLDLSNVDLSSHNNTDNMFFLPFLHYLNVSNCSLSSISLYYISSLKVLDVSNNKLTNFSLLRLSENPTLIELDISNNPVVFLFENDLEIMMCNKGKLLRNLNLQRTGLSRIRPDTFICNKTLSTLQQLNIAHNIIKLEPNSFRGLGNLVLLYTSDDLSCCAFIFSNQYSKADCISPKNELSSCDDLLRSNIFRVFLWLQCLAALLGNGGVLIYRLCDHSKHLVSGYHSFVTSLCVSDFAVGVYLMVIGIADLHYKGQYLWQREEWMQSVSCTVAGILAMMSNELSSFIICLITFDRLLVVRFPLHRKLHFTRNSAFMASCLAFITGIIIAIIPVLPFHTPWNFYSQNGICLPLPITRHTFPGAAYTFAVFIVVNVVMFLLIGFGQVLIYIFIKVSPKAGRTTNRQQEFAVAKRLFLVAFTNFCCWFPVGFTGLLARGGTAIPGEVNVWAAVFLVPLNSAINPFIYTLSTLRQNQLRRKEKGRLENLLRKFEANISTFSKERVDAFSSAVFKTQTRFVSKTAAVKYKELNDIILILSEEELIHVIDFAKQEI